MRGVRYRRLLTSSAPNDTAPSHASSLAVLKAPGEHAASISRSRSDDEGTLSATARASSALRSLESPLRPSSRPTPSSSVFVYSPRHASSVPAGSRSRARSRRMASFCSKRPSSHASKRSSKAAARSASVSPASAPRWKPGGSCSPKAAIRASRSASAKRRSTARLRPASLRARERATKSAAVRTRPLARRSLKSAWAEAATSGPNSMPSTFNMPS